jgi:hypothetical protein
MRLATVEKQQRLAANVAGLIGQWPARRVATYTGRLPTGPLFAGGLAVLTAVTLVASATPVTASLFWPWATGGRRPSVERAPV